MEHPKQVLQLVVICPASLALRVSKRDGYRQMPNKSNRSAESPPAHFRIQKNILTLYFHLRDVLQPTSHIPPPPKVCTFAGGFCQPRSSLAFSSNLILLDVTEDTHVKRFAVSQSFSPPQT